MARSGVTFPHTRTGPKGALRDRPACAIGIGDVRVIQAERRVAGGPAAAQATREALDKVLPAAPARASSKLRGSAVREHTR